MKLTPWIAFSLIAIATPSSSQACFGHRGRCSGHHRPVVATCAAPVAMPMMAAPVATPMMTAATPQMTQATPTMAPQPVATAQPVVDQAQPTYDYTASPNGVPAYYYTYDRSGKLIVAQWMDWVFRGGRAAGEPAPPLPIIGALRNR